MLYRMAGHSGVMELTSPSRVLPVASITAYLDLWLDTHSEAKIDCVHDLEVFVIVIVNTKCANSSEISMDPVTFKSCPFFIFFLQKILKLNPGEEVTYGRGASDCSSGNSLHSGKFKKVAVFLVTLRLAGGRKGKQRVLQKTKTQERKQPKTRARLLRYLVESTAAQNYMNKNTDAFKYKAESDISFTKAESSAAQYHENQIIDLYKCKGETEGKYEYSDDDRKQLSDSSVKRKRRSSENHHSVRENDRKKDNQCQL